MYINSIASKWLSASTKRRHSFTVRICACHLLFFLLSGLALSSTGEGIIHPRRILILYEAGTAYPGIRLVEQGLRDVLDSSPVKLEIYREYLETILFPDSADQNRFREFYLRKYRDRRPDVIITVGPSALKFMIETHESAFPGVPIVFCLPYWVPGTLGEVDSHFTGVLNDVSAGKTIQAAVQLVPGTKHIIVIGGMAFNDIQWTNAVKEQLRPYEGRFEISYLTNLAMPDLLERLRHLPDHTVVYYSSMSQDAEGNRFISGGDALSMVAGAADAPVFVSLDSFLHAGVVGGVVTSFRQQGKIAGGLALRILQGEKPQDIPKVSLSAIPMFDWQGLKRWGLSAKNLSPGSIILNQEISFWVAYKQYVITGIAVFLIQAVAILGLLLERARRRKAEIGLGKSEEKFSKAFRRSPLAITIVRLTDSRYVEVNEIFEADTGWLRDEVVGRTALEIGLWVDPDQRAAFLRQLLESGTVKDIEVRFRRKDGQVRTSLGSAELIELNGEQCALSVIADITERKQAEEAMATVGSRLIEAQEVERTRIARELHDDINQRLAMVAIILESTKQDLPASEVETNRQLQQATAKIGELGNDIQALSHRLYSSRLEYFGLELAASGFCSEMSERQNVKINFRYGDIPGDLSDQISLCLFRVLQEAVHNAVKYSGVDEFDVSFTGSSGEIELRVHDSGVGFDPKETSKGHGLGLISMKERLKLVRGELSIDSRPEDGTTVLARVPLDCDKAAPAEEKLLDLVNQSAPQA